MKNKILLLCLALILVASFVVPGCKPAPPVEEVKPVKIGAIFPLTGPLAAIGTEIKQTVELAADIVNNSYDIDLPFARGKGLPGLGGAPIEVVFADSKGSPETGLAEAERLIETEGVVALIGAYQSSVTETASFAAERLGIPFLNGDSTFPGLTDRGFKWFFRNTPHDYTFSETFFKFLEDLKKKEGLAHSEIENVAILYEDTLWGVGTSNAEKDLIAKKYPAGYVYKIVADIAYPAATASVTSEVMKLKAAKPDIVFQASYLSDALLFQKEYKALDFSPKAILAMDAGHIHPDFVAGLGADANYIFTREVWSLDLKVINPLIGIVNDMYYKRHGKNMDGTTARDFTALMVMADVLNRAGSTEPEAIRKALIETDIPAAKLIMPWRGVKYDEKGQNMYGEGVISQIIDQSWHTVYPPEFALKDWVYPQPTWAER
ncbi:MAG: branched-chain amino acid ABC transporter substrate-binding protein [Chloroflexi bacterium CG07_land_8_20_14_0_80_45_17]|nr:MAG: branched-chain amino acid ABC transporter substrate-binding protein [Chloroflexi bacterium CG07_land_8_20_14_0_80_45_17]